jgi:hypothetical protein
MIGTWFLWVCMGGGGGDRDGVMLMMGYEIGNEGIKNAVKMREWVLKINARDKGREQG